MWGFESSREPDTLLAVSSEDGYAKVLQCGYGGEEDMKLEFNSRNPNRKSGRGGGRRGHLLDRQDAGRGMTKKQKKNKYKRNKNKGNKFGRNHNRSGGGYQDNDR